MKVSSTSLILIFNCTLIFSQPPSQYQSMAQQWTSSHFDSSSHPDDLQLIINLLYFSYLRSHTTVQAQKAALAAIETTWHGWQNIAQTRMNPSHKAPYQINLKKQENLLLDFVHQQEAHQKIGMQYAALAEYVVNEVEFAHDESHKAIKELRTHAREIAAKAFTDVKKIVGELFDAAWHYNNKNISLEEIPDLESRFDLFDTLWSYVPQYALKPFLDTEKMHTAASEKTWQILASVQQVNKKLWDAIETARANYYLAHYQTLYALMKKQCPQALSIRIDEKGMLLAPDECKMALPDLSKRS